MPRQTLLRPSLQPSQSLPRGVVSRSPNIFFSGLPRSPLREGQNATTTSILSKEVGKERLNCLKQCEHILDTILLMPQVDYSLCAISSFALDIDRFIQNRQFISHNRLTGALWVFQIIRKSSRRQWTFQPCDRILQDRSCAQEKLFLQMLSQ